MIKYIWGVEYVGQLGKEYQIIDSVYKSHEEAFKRYEELRKKEESARVIYIG